MKYKVMFITSYVWKETSTVTHSVVEFDTKEQARDAMTSFRNCTKEEGHFDHQAIPLYLENTK